MKVVNVTFLQNFALRFDSLNEYLRWSFELDLVEDESENPMSDSLTSTNIFICIQSPEVTNLSATKEQLASLRWLPDWNGERRLRPDVLPNIERYNFQPQQFFDIVGKLLRACNIDRDPPKEEIREIIVHINTKFKATYLEYIWLIISYYLLDEICEVLRIFNEIKSFYSNNRISRDQFEFVDKFVRHATYVGPAQSSGIKRDVTFVLAPRNANELDIMEDLVEYLKGFKLSDIVFNPYVSLKEINYATLKRKLKRDNEMIVFLGHGAREEGLKLTFATQADLPIRKTQYNEMRSYLLRKNKDLLVFLGCDGHEYAKEDFNICNRIYTSTGWSQANESEVFLIGVIKSLNKTNDVTNHYNLGRISLMLRSRSVYQIHLGYHTP